MSTTEETELCADQIRLMSIVARLYHVQHHRQRDIADRLGVSQASVSRLLRQAQSEGIVQTVIDVPAGLHPELEERIEDEFGISEVHVVEVHGGDAAMARVLGRAAARLFPTGALSGRVVGFASCSPTLQEMAFALDDPLPRAGTRYVVQTLAAAGSVAEQQSAKRATRRLADSLGASAVLLHAGAVTSSSARGATGTDLCMSGALRLLDRLDVAFVDVGPVYPRQAGTEDGRAVPAVRRHGPGVAPVVGQVNQRWIDLDGRPVPAPTDVLVGLTLPQLRRARRRIAIVGGSDRTAAIAAALRGGWVDTLMTDLDTARGLVEPCGGPPLPLAGRTK